MKIKSTRSDEFVIGGYTRGTGARARAFGALLLGQYDADRRLVPVGHVGTGFDDRGLRALRARLDALRREDIPFATPPALNAAATWVEPKLVAEVKYAERTRDGLLRTPVFLGLRDDKRPADARPADVAPAPADVAPPRSYGPRRCDLVERQLPRCLSIKHAERRGARYAADAAASRSASFASEASSPSAAPAPADPRVASVLEQVARGGRALPLSVEGHELSLTNLDKVFWPAAGNRPALTKRDFIAYLARLAPYLLPHLRDRPLTLIRYPGGIGGKHFFQQHAGAGRPRFKSRPSVCTPSRTPGTASTSSATTWPRWSG